MRSEGLGRFIPAGAGTSYEALQDAIAKAVHPRGGGDKAFPQSPACRAIGSSPRGRGQGTPVPLLRVLRRFIPAGAGTSQAPPLQVAPHPVHPRGGGDKVTSSVRFSRPPGSSPRGRGQDAGFCPCVLLARFIPAGAGTSFASPVHRRIRPVHPRGGGDKDCHRLCQGPSHGSSPRGRGQVGVMLLRLTPTRFIPAGAGTSRRGRVARQRCPVHPRGGGDKRQHFPWRRARVGSSPRGRGQVMLVWAVGYAVRFIPAGAGTSERTTP